MSETMLPFNQAMAQAEAAKTPEETHAVLREVSARLGAANSALAVDSAKSILDVILKKGPAHV